MPPKVFVVLVVLNLDEFVGDGTSADLLPMTEVTGDLDLNQALSELISRVGLLPNLGVAKLVDIAVGDDGTLVIGYRIRTCSRGLNDGYVWWKFRDTDLREWPEERHLLDRAWEGERP